jgi:hypothetical protein
LENGKEIHDPHRSSLLEDESGCFGDGPTLELSGKHRLLRVHELLGKSRVGFEGSDLSGQLSPLGTGGSQFGGQELVLGLEFPQLALDILVVALVLACTRHIRASVSVLG